MAIDSISANSRESVLYTWGAGITGGFVGGIAMGMILHAGANVMPFIGGLYGWPTVLGGWVSHLVNSILLGMVFALLVSRWGMHDRTTNLGNWAFYGGIYAAGIGLLTGGIILPITVNLIQLETLSAPQLPFPGAVGSLLLAFSVGVAHMAYGVVLGVIYGRIHRRSVSNNGSMD